MVKVVWKYKLKGHILFCVECTHFFTHLTSHHIIFILGNVNVNDTDDYDDQNDCDEYKILNSIILASYGSGETTFFGILPFLAS